MIEAFHSLGVTHRDLRPENFFFDIHEDSPLKNIDFGLSIFCKPGTWNITNEEDVPCGPHCYLQVIVISPPFFSIT